MCFKNTVEFCQKKVKYYWINMLINKLLKNYKSSKIEDII